MRELIALAVLSCAGFAQEAPPVERRPFVRFVERADGGQLDVLVATYEKGDATLVLHGALHVADPEHYQELQKRFAAFDVLLYELIAEEGLRPHPEMELDDSGDALSLLVGGFGRGLGLVEQMASVDYRHEHFVHADLTDAQWEEALESGGTNLWFELLSTGGAPDTDREAEAKIPKQDFVAAARRGTSTHELRVAFARVLATPEGVRRFPTVIIERRNERCLEVLQQQLGAGRKKLGIYYGAAHMEHMERRLVQDLGWRRTGEEWLTAWDNRASRFAPVEKGLQQKRYRARQDVDALTEALRAWAKENRGKAPTWDALRKAQPGGKLPGRADGVDPWGRPYELHVEKGATTVRCLGSDGTAGTDDDIGGDGVKTGKPGFFERLFSSSDDARPSADDERARERVAHFEGARRDYDAAVVRAQKRQGQTGPTKSRIDAALEKQAIALTEGQVVVVQLAVIEWKLRQRDMRSVPQLRQLGETARLSADPWGNPLRIVDVGAGEIEIRSDGPDGKPDTADDIVAK